jgi:hypothetical protein
MPFRGCQKHNISYCFKFLSEISSIGAFFDIPYREEVAVAVLNSLRGQTDGGGNIAFPKFQTAAKGGKCALFSLPEFKLLLTPGIGRRRVQYSEEYR